MNVMILFVKANEYLLLACVKKYSMLTDLIYLLICIIWSWECYLCKNQTSTYGTHLIQKASVTNKYLFACWASVCAASNLVVWLTSKLSDECYYFMLKFMQKNEYKQYSRMIFNWINILLVSKLNDEECYIICYY